MAPAEDDNFERVFGIAPTHRLVAVRSRVRGGPIQQTYWEHKEITPNGELCARYEAWDETAPGGVQVLRWKQLDAEGRIVKTIE